METQRLTELSGQIGDLMRWADDASVMVAGRGANESTYLEPLAVSEEYMSQSKLKPAGDRAATRMTEPLNRGCLALDSLSRLTREFAENHDIGRLAEFVILTLCGQFAVPDVFICLRNPAARTDPPIFAGTGHWKNKEEMGAVGRLALHDVYFLRNSSPQRVREIAQGEIHPGTIGKLADFGAEVTIPMVHDDRLLGLIALGQKANRKEYPDEELELLTTVVDSISPLIVNTFLFEEISVLNAWYLDILNSVQQGVFICDSNFQLKKLNRAGIEIIRRHCPELPRPGDLTGLAVHHLFPEDIFPGWARHLVRATAGYQGSAPAHFVTAGEGEKCVYSVRVGLIPREVGSRSDIVVTAEDITEQKRNEQHLFDLEKFAEKGVMASSISHELNNFLGLILGGVELSQMATRKNDADKAYKSLEIVKSNIAQMRRFTSGLMDYSRLDTKKEQVSFNGIVSDVMAFLTVQRKFKGIVIKTDLEASLPEIELDADQIAQLLLNLLNNAADSIREAGREGGEIQISTGVVQEAIRLTVTDNGKGMAEEVRRKLFSSRLTTKKDGHGYGLVTCARIVENHRARVDIVSEPGSGATFILDFPVTG